MRASLYARVSDEEQVDGYSIEGQLDLTRKYAIEHGWHVVEEYVDPGFSAFRRDNRPAFKQMIADAKLGKFDAILVLRGDRFARNRMHASMYKNLLREVGVRVISISEPVEEGTPAGVILEGMGEVIAEWYSVDLSVKVTEALKRRAEKGLWVGPVPFGYARSDNNTLAPIPDEVEAVQRAFDMYASGRYTFSQIATWLNATNHRPRVHLRDRKGRQFIWSKDTVKDMLANVFYLGSVKYNGRLIEGKHPPIVDQRAFDKVQEVRKLHRRGPSTFAQKYRVYLLKGLVRCVSCGEKLWAHHIKGKDYYREENALRGIPCPNQKAYQRAEVFDNQVSAIIEKLQLPTTWRDLVVELLNSKGEVVQIQREHKRLEEKIRRIKIQFREGDIDEREYRLELELTRATLASLQLPEDHEMMQLGDHIEGITEAWKLATKEERHDLLKMMLDAVYVDMPTGRVVGIKPKPAFLPLFNLKEPVKAGKMLLVTGDPEGI